MAGYQFYNDLLSLVHFDGANGSNTVVDTSPVAGTWTGVSNPISTARAKFGSSSAYFINGLDYIYSGAAILPTSSDFTLSMWVYTTTTGGGGDYYVSVRRASASNGVILGMYSNGKSWLRFYRSEDSTSINIYGATMPINQWVHMEASRNGDTWRMFLNGTLQGSTTLSGSVEQTPIYIGTNGTWTSSSVYIDELAVHDFCLHTSNFTPLAIPIADYQLNDKLLPRKDLAIQRPAKLNQNYFVNRIGI